MRRNSFEQPVKVAVLSHTSNFNNQAILELFRNIMYHAIKIVDFKLHLITTSNNIQRA